MYKKAAKGWLKHFDFIIIDVLCVQLAFILAYMVRHGIELPYKSETYRNMAIMLIFFDLFVAFFCESYKSILKRGYVVEFKAMLQHVIYVMFISTFFLFMLKLGGDFSRMVLVWTGIFFGVLSYSSRIIWKKHIKRRRNFKGGNRSLILVTSKDYAESVIQNLALYNYNGLKLSGVVMVDGEESDVGQAVCGIPIIATMDTITEYIRIRWVDEVFIALSRQWELPYAFMKSCSKMGITVHLALATMNKASGEKQFISRLGSYTVLSSCINYATTRQLFTKRVMDIIGGLLGCIVTGIFIVFIGPFIYIKSPGSIFFVQERVGKNGKKFKMYKFRSMYLDAEERKAELMKMNKIQDGMMFKIDNDPRIIGGEKGKGIGNFIRNTSIDEWPQFWNVLKGDMSLVGTRPPTVDEWEKYELHHRARLATKPGITGMWQVSGRSEITDFEQVVDLDMEYIGKWNISLDLKILAKTVQVVLLGKGAV